MMDIVLNLNYTIDPGGDLVSTWVTKPEVHVELAIKLVKSQLQSNLIGKNTKTAANDNMVAIAA